MNIQFEIVLSASENILERIKEKGVEERGGGRESRGEERERTQQKVG